MIALIPSRTPVTLGPSLTLSAAVPGINLKLNLNSDPDPNRTPILTLTLTPIGGEQPVPGAGEAA